MELAYFYVEKFDVMFLIYLWYVYIWSVFISDTALEIDPNDDTKTIFCKLRHPKTGGLSVMFHHLYLMFYILNKTTKSFWHYMTVLQMF